MNVEVSSSIYDNVVEGEYHEFTVVTDTSRERKTGADLLLSAFEILIKYVKKNKQINGFNIEIQVFETEKSEFTGI